MLPPGSPATTIVRTGDLARSMPSSLATSARRRAYVGVQQRTLAPWVKMARNLAALLKPPPGMLKAPSASPASNASQKPMNGPNENAKKTRSAALTPAARKMSLQFSIIHCQLSGVSSQRNGSPLVPLVWWTRV